MAISLNSKLQEKPMKQGEVFFNKFFNRDIEFKVAEMLLRLPQLISESESRNHSPPICWGAKRKRSAIDESSSPPSVLPPCNPSSSNVDETLFKLETPSPESPSPASPLSFSLGESDSRLIPSKKKSSSKKKKRQQLVEEFSRLSQENELLKNEVSKVREYSEKLRNFNVHLKLRAEEIELRLSQVRDDLNLNSSDSRSRSRSSSFTLSQEPEEPTTATSSVPEQKKPKPIILIHQPLVDFQHYQYPNGQTIPSSSSSSRMIFTMEKHLSPLGIPDLNFSPEETNEIDFLHQYNLNKVEAAEARKRRFNIKKLKKNSSMAAAAVKPRFR